MKMTDWFPPDVKPVHKGWYHTSRGGKSPENESDESMFNWYWDGEKWGAVYDNHEAFISEVQNRWWRGIAK